MSTKTPNRPVLIGASQMSQRDVTFETAMNPIDMFERIAREAADASGANDPTKLLASIDTIALTAAAGAVLANRRCFESPARVRLLAAVRWPDCTVLKESSMRIHALY